jgi:hypothetical protein
VEADTPDFTQKLFRAGIANMPPAMMNWCGAATDAQTPMAPEKAGRCSFREAGFSCILVKASARSRGLIKRALSYGRFRRLGNDRAIVTWGYAKEVGTRRRIRVGLGAK